MDRGGDHAVVCCQEFFDFDAIDLDRDDAVGEIDFDELTDVFEHEPPGRLSCHRGVQVPDFLDWDDIPDDDGSHDSVCTSLSVHGQQEHEHTHIHIEKAIKTVPLACASTFDQQSCAPSLSCAHLPRLQISL